MSVGAFLRICGRAAAVTNTYGCSRAQLGEVRDDMPRTLQAAEIAALRSMPDRLDIREAEDIIAAVQLLGDYVDGHQRRFFRNGAFLGIEETQEAP